MKAATREFLLMLACLLAAAAVATIVSMLVVTVNPTYDANGEIATERTVVLPDGQRMNFEARGYGWPVPYYSAGCWGMNDRCDTYKRVDLPSLIMNTLAWFAVAAGVWSAYYYTIRTRVKKTRQP